MGSQAKYCSFGETEAWGKVHNAGGLVLPSRFCISIARVNFAFKSLSGIGTNLSQHCLGTVDGTLGVTTAGSTPSSSLSPSAQQFVTLSSWVCHSCHCGMPWEVGTRGTTGCGSTAQGPEELRGHPGRRKQLHGEKPHQRFLSHDGEIACGERL